MSAANINDSRLSCSIIIAQRTHTQSWSRSAWRFAFAGRSSYCNADGNARRRASADATNDAALCRRHGIVSAAGCCCCSNVFRCLKSMCCCCCCRSQRRCCRIAKRMRKAGSQIIFITAEIKSHTKSHTTRVTCAQCNAVASAYERLDFAAVRALRCASFRDLLRLIDMQVSLKIVVILFCLLCKQFIIKAIRTRIIWRVCHPAPRNSAFVNIGTNHCRRRRWRHRQRIQCLMRSSCRSCLPTPSSSSCSLAGQYLLYRTSITRSSWCVC